MIETLLTYGGGHFDNPDVAEALNVGIAAASLQKQLNDMAVTACRPTEDIVAILALKIRVMVSHKRPRGSLTPPAKNAKSSIHPFVNYRDRDPKPDSDDDDGDAEQTHEAANEAQDRHLEFEVWDPGT